MCRVSHSTDGAPTRHQQREQPIQVALQRRTQWRKYSCVLTQLAPLHLNSLNRPTYLCRKFSICKSARLDQVCMLRKPRTFCIGCMYSAFSVITLSNHIGFLGISLSPVCVKRHCRKDRCIIVKTVPGACKIISGIFLRSILRRWFSSLCTTSK